MRHMDILRQVAGGHRAKPTESRAWTYGRFLHKCQKIREDAWLEGIPEDARPAFQLQMLKEARDIMLIADEELLAGTMETCYL